MYAVGIGVNGEAEENRDRVPSRDKWVGRGTVESVWNVVWLRV